MDELEKEARSRAASPANKGQEKQKNHDFKKLIGRLLEHIKTVIEYEQF